jgi:hypothetical protein
MDYLSFDSSTDTAYTIVCVFYGSGISAKRKLFYQSALNSIQYLRIECMNIIGFLELRGIPCIVGVDDLYHFQGAAVRSQFPPFQKAVLESKGEIKNSIVLLPQKIGDAAVVGNL